VLHFFSSTAKAGDKALKFDIWDTAGQERYNCLAPMYYRGANGAFLVYDITNINSFHKAIAWEKELRRACIPNIVIVLVGNKSDLKYDSQIPVEEAISLANSTDIIWGGEISCKTGDGVAAAYGCLYSEIYLTYLNQSNSPNNKKVTVVVDNENFPANQSSCCGGSGGSGNSDSSKFYGNNEPVINPERLKIVMLGDSGVGKSCLTRYQSEVSVDLTQIEKNKN